MTDEYMDYRLVLEGRQLEATHVEATAGRLDKVVTHVHPNVAEDMIADLYEYYVMQTGEEPELPDVERPGLDDA